MKTIQTLLLLASLSLTAHAVERWGVFELSLIGEPQRGGAPLRLKPDCRYYVITKAN